jgi:hypothetical protein
MKTGILTFPSENLKEEFMLHSTQIPQLERLEIFVRQCAPTSIVYSATDVQQGLSVVSLASVYHADYQSLEDDGLAPA